MKQEDLDIVGKPRVIQVGSESVRLDPTKMMFNEASLSRFNDEMYVWYNYFGERLADAENICVDLEREYEKKYYDTFFTYKNETGCSDKLAEAKAKSDVEIDALKKTIIDAKHNVRLLQQHLRAWDKANENAQSRGHMLRKEMDKLNTNIYLNKEKELDLDERIGQIFNEPN